MYGFFVSFLVMGGFVGAVAVIAGLIARYRASRGIQNRYDSPQLTIATATIAIAVGLLDMVIGAIAFNLWET
jgi:hypothetical protein